MGVHDLILQLDITVPAAGNQFAFSAAVAPRAANINLEDKGSTSGHQTGGTQTAPAAQVAQLLGDGHPIYANFRVIEAFTVSAGTPAAQFGVHSSISTNAADPGGNVTLALTGGPAVTGTNDTIGFVASDLVVGASVDVVVPPWTQILNASVDPQDLQYLFGAIFVPNYHEAGSTTGFSAGKVRMSLTAQPLEAYGDKNRVYGQSGFSLEHPHI